MSGKVPPPVRCETLAQIVGRFGGTLEATAGKTREDYALPERATAEVRAFFGRTASAESGPDFLARLPGGRVFRAGIVLSPDGTSLARDVSLDFGKTESEHWLLGSKDLRPPKFLDGATAVVASTLASGYGHWLLDELPRLLALGDAAKGARLIAHTTHAFAGPALALSGWRGAVIEPQERTHVQCEELIVPSLVGSVERPAARARRQLNAFVAPLHAASRFGERLYLSRETARRRRVSNEPELWAKLEARGFVKLRLETLSWQEQINAFRGAKTIVAPHGAGLANLVFCGPGTRVVEFFNRSYVNGCYWRLAAVAQLDYRAVVPAGEAALADSPAGNRLDLVADVERVLAELDAH